MLADLALVDLHAVAFTPLNDLREQLVHCEDGRDVVLTMVAGRVVAEHGHVTSVDEVGAARRSAGAVRREAARDPGRPRAAPTGCSRRTSTSCAARPQRMSASAAGWTLMINPADYPYTPLPDRPTGSWPNGAQLAVVVCVGVESYRFGDGHTEDVLPGVPAPDLVNTAWRDYGNRVGAFRIFELLRGLGIPPTVLLNTDVYDEAPAVMEAARRAGAEIVGHGRSNSDSLSADDPRRRARLPHGRRRPHPRRTRGRHRAAGPAPGSATPRRP